MATNLEDGIESIVTRAVADVVRLVRQSVSEDIERVVGSVARRAVREPAAAAPPSTSGRRGRKRGGAVADIESVLDFIGKNPGLRSEQIQKQLGGAPEPVRKALAKLRESGRAKTKGAKRATVYFVA